MEREGQIVVRGGGQESNGKQTVGRQIVDKQMAGKQTVAGKRWQINDGTYWFLLMTNGFLKSDPRT